MDTAGSFENRRRARPPGLAWGVGLASAALIGACSQTPIVATPRSFDRPGRASLVCFEMETTPPTAVPLARCAPEDPATGTLPSGFDLHAVVLQSRRGEIAVVDLRTNAILDSNATIPGFTFIEAGALPVDVVSTQGVVPARPIATYGANAGSDRGSALPGRAQAQGPRPRQRRWAAPAPGRAQARRTAQRLAATSCPG